VSSDQTWRERTIEARRESDDALIAYRAEHDRLTVERDAALATIERVRALLPKWESELVDYPPTNEANYARAGVTLCMREVRAALEPSS